MLIFKKPVEKPTIKKPFTTIGITTQTIKTYSAISIESIFSTLKLDIETKNNNNEELLDIAIPKLFNIFNRNIFNPNNEKYEKCYNTPLKYYKKYIYSLGNNKKYNEEYNKYYNTPLRYYESNRYESGRYESSRHDFNR